MTVNGVLNLYKPAGETSMDMVRTVKRLTGQKKVGHGGTLDPIASGVLPICFGQATRLMDPLVDGVKRYHTRVRLGETTDTYDAAGTITATADASGVTLEDVEAALEGFRGVIRQVPPMYSALKQGGERLYDLARAGFEVEREAREVTVHSLTLEAFEPPDVVLDIVCGRGVLRALAGARPGADAGLRRTRRRARAARRGAVHVGRRGHAGAVPGGGGGRGVDGPRPPAGRRGGEPAAGTVAGALETFVKSGRSVVLGGREGMEPPRHGELWRVYGHDGELPRAGAVRQADGAVAAGEGLRRRAAGTPARGGRAGVGSRFHSLFLRKRSCVR